MKIIKKNEEGWDEVRRLEQSLISYFETTRFTFVLDSSVGKRKLCIAIKKIRLKQSKLYCGNHPGPCVIEGGKRRKSNYLEGLDWVSFNDILNNWADMLSLNSDIASISCVIRIGKKRRISYNGHNLGTPQAEWDKYGDYENYCGEIAPSSFFPPSTPGGYSFV